MIEPAAVALRAVRLAKVKKGDKALVIGAGIIGVLCAQFLKHAGASYVAITETNEARAKKALKLGVCHEWFNATDEKLPEIFAEKTKNGFDVVLDCCGNSAALTSAINFTKPGGNLMFVGVSMLPVTIPLISGIMKEINMKGSIGYSAKDFDDTIYIAENNIVNLELFIDDIVSLEEVQSAFERLTSGEDDAIKILVDPKKRAILKL